MALTACPIGLERPDILMVLPRELLACRKISFSRSPAYAISISAIPNTSIRNHITILLFSIDFPSAERIHFLLGIACIFLQSQIGDITPSAEYSLYPQINGNLYSLNASGHFC